MEHKLKHTGTQIDEAIDKVFGIDSSAEEINEAIDKVLDIEPTAEEINEAIRSVGNKVDKEEGKGLISDEELAKLANVKRADWNDNNPFSWAYIKNRTHSFQPWSEETTIDISEETLGSLISPVSQFFSVNGIAHSSEEANGQEFEVQDSTGYDKFDVVFQGEHAYLRHTWHGGTDRTISVCSSGKVTPLTPAYIPDAIARKKDVDKKQDALTLTVKDNGNIVIGNIEGQTKEFMPATPSGDPMHYKYLKVHGLTYDESTGLWAYRASEGGLTDLTTDEVANMYIVGGSPGVQDDAWCRWAGNISNVYPARTNIWPFFYGSTQGLTSTMNFSFAFVNNRKLIVAVVSERAALECGPKECSGMFRYSQKLVRVIGKINLTSVTNTGQSNLHMFGFCNALEEVDIIKLKASIHFGESPLLSKRSLLYMIQNAKPTTAITITLHAEAYARLANDADIVAALAAQPNISLIKS